MTRINLFAASALLALGAAGCSKPQVDVPPVSTADAGYLAVRVNLEKSTRGSTEDPGLTTESELKSVYLVTFSSTDGVVANPDGGHYTKLDATQLAAAQTSAVFTAKVAGSTDKVMAVANPGTKLLAALNGLNAGSSFTTFNAAIADIDVSELNASANGFAMISCRSDKTLATGNKIEDALIKVNPTLVSAAYPTDQQASDAAKASPVQFSIERLASKVYFKPLPANVEVLPAGASFAFVGWTVDAVNSTCYPFAEKTVIGAATDHTGAVYKYNFYTRDPNYVDKATYHDGLKYVAIDAATKEPALLTGYAWAGADKYNYVVENTMDAAAQRYGNATRIVVKGRYAPAGFTAGADWFSYGGVNYKTLADLQTAYSAAGASSGLVAACDAFALQMEYTGAFTAMTASDLKSTNGGEWAKVPATGVGVRYYQGALNYWFYEIRHNGLATGTMEYSKYGAVRNNWYNCKLEKVTGAGTPWYPDLKNPGDGDPDPYDPIDEEYGYIGIEITPAPWIVWENGMAI